MGWNHRVIRTEDKGGVCYAIHECHYDKKGDTIPTSWTEEPTSVHSETRTGLFWQLAVMTEAVAQPVLEIRDDKLVEIERVRELTDDLKKAIATNKEYAEGMDQTPPNGEEERLRDVLDQIRGFCKANDRPECNHGVALGFVCCLAASALTTPA